MSSIIIHTLRPNTQEYFCYLHEIYVSANVNFSHFEELKTLFHIAPFRSTSYVVKSSGVWSSVMVYRIEIKAIPSFSLDRYVKNANWKYRYSYTN